MHGNPSLQPETMCTFPQGSWIAFLPYKKKERACFAFELERQSFSWLSNSLRAILVSFWYALPKILSVAIHQTYIGLTFENGCLGVLYTCSKKSPLQSIQLCRNFTTLCCEAIMDIIAKDVVSRYTSDLYRTDIWEWLLRCTIHMIKKSPLQSIEFCRNFTILCCEAIMDIIAKDDVSRYISDLYRTDIWEWLLRCTLHMFKKNHPFNP